MIKLSDILKEAGRTGIMRGTAEKEMNTGIRKDFKRTNINYGGCGVFAQLMYYAIKKEFGVSPIILTLLRHNASNRNRYKNDANINNFKSLGDFSDVGYMLSHIIIEIPNSNYCIDSDGIHSKKWFDIEYTPDRYNDKMTIQTLTRWARNKESWNDMFDRAEIPNIVKKIDAIMANVHKVINGK